MNNTIVPQNEALLNALERLTKALESNKINSPWLTKVEAAAYMHIAFNTFEKLIKSGVIKSHSLHNLGIAVERFNRNELDQFMEAL